tara:strand:- start:2502 stop:3263 length:762 start_codon:yes stop_codon:yes gene_type:complete
MNQVATREEQENAPAHHEQEPGGNNLVSLIQQIIMRPDIDVDKVERFLEMQQRIEAKQAERAFIEDLSAMQHELPAVRQNGTGHNKTKYAKWEDIQAAILPVLSSHGFSISHKTRVENNTVVVTCLLRHRDGHTDQTELPLPFDGSGSKNPVQAVGSSVSYGKRYTAAALLGIRVEGEDDDGAGATVSDKTLSEKQISELRDLLADLGRDEGKFVTYLNNQNWPGASLEEMSEDVFKPAKSLLDGFKAKEQSK